MLWNLFQKKDRLWIQWIHQYYMKQDNFFTFMPKVSASWIIKVVFKHRNPVIHTDTWNGFDTTGKFHTRLLYQDLLGSHPMVPWRNLLHGNGGRPRAIFTLWMTCFRRLNTKDRLVRFSTITDRLCLFCDEVETCDHFVFCL